MEIVSEEDFRHLKRTAGFSGREARAFELHHVEGRELPEVAAEMGIKQSSVRTNIARAKRKISIRKARQPHVDFATMLLAVERLVALELEVEAEDQDKGERRRLAETIWECFQRVRSNPQTPQFDSDNPAWASAVATHGTAIAFEDVLRIVCTSGRRRYYQSQG